MMLRMLAAGLRNSWRPCTGMILLLVLAAPPIRRATEASMTAHMLVQYPALMLAGGLLVEGLPGRWLHEVQRWNELGITGLVGSALTLAVLMVPRALDLALIDIRVESLKLGALILSGAALRLSWQRAGIVVQVFFLGNVLPMMVVVGTLYQGSATRVCNAYRLDDQKVVGLALICIAVSIASLWLLRLGLQSRDVEPRVPQGPVTDAAKPIDQSHAEG
jgi:hypothetical protein